MAASAVDPTIPHGPLLDIMNDPQYATNTTEGTDEAGDMDTCRICRGEGSDSEPLFHPCKCSGSIKHVHQDCLMEWLSHSQKKHCELCKTPFRFTKLYSPNMPQSLPPGVLFHHFILHSARNIGTWLRFCLVSTVWLGCLPFTIRQVWRILFWFSDGGWPSDFLGADTANNLASQTMEMARQFESAIIAGNGTSPVTPLSAAQTTPASVGGIADAVLSIFKPVSDTMNMSASDPLILGFMKSLYYGFGITEVAIPDEPLTNSTDMGLLPSIRSTSLLSEVSCLKNLTRNPWINQIIIAICEGYIITIVVVVAFILVFLIREWVVQQQPGINMGAGFNADFPGDRPRDIADVQERRNVQLRPGRLVMDNLPEARDIADRPIAQHRRRNLEVDLANHTERLGELRERRDATDLVDVPIQLENIQRSVQNRPAAVRDALSPATEIQRQLAEAPLPRMTEEFLNIWRRANGTPEDVLRIIEEEDKSEDMRYWVIAMEHLRDPLPGSSAMDPSPLITFSTPLSPNSASASTSSLVAQPGSDGGSGTSDSWVDVAKPFTNRKDSPGHDSSERTGDSAFDFSTMEKGKAKAQEDPKQPLFDPATQLLPGMHFNRWTQAPAHAEKPSFPPSILNISRPRAISDGPHPRDSISPLANNNWSFSSLDEGNTETKGVSLHSVSDIGPSTWRFGPNLHAQPTDDLTPGSKGQKNAENLSLQEDVANSREVVDGQNSSLERSISRPDRSFDPPSLDKVEQGIDRPIELFGQDGTTRTYENVEEKFATNPPSDSESEEADAANQSPEPNPLVPDTPLPPLQEPIAQHLPGTQGILGNVAEFLWGGNDDGQQDEGANEEHVVHDIAAEAPFVPVAHHDHLDQAEELPQQDREVVEAALAAGLDPNDPDVIDDAEDFEGIMELIGMRGPIFSLVQNAVFCAFLLALTVAFGVWIPYNIGRVSLLLVANPGPTFKLPLRLIFWTAAFMQDLAVSLFGFVSYCSIKAVSLALRMFSSPAIASGWAEAALRLSFNAVNRILDGTVTSIVSFSDAEMFMFSAASHEALLNLKCHVMFTLDAIGRRVIFCFVGDYQVTLAEIVATVLVFLLKVYKVLLGLPAFLATSDTWVISLEVAKRSTPLDLRLSVWDSTDRIWATIAGYTALSVLGTLYVSKGTPFSNGPIGREWEATVIDLLHQAGGVMKVILIISIEMLVFPLYCGLLLDAALLPLFEGATIMSRILFTFTSPATSIFVHWFVGTCYMFHFALFVSMCRKIMRKGVLCKSIIQITVKVLLILADFIRDPDDPTFHPVRDVLERNVATQLRKILFSALVYGALVVVCLGGVVWGLSFAFKGVLPIHWSSNEPVLEFPIDLLFYNFLMPLAVRFFKPSDGLHSMYSWWFRQCARMLRLTWFMFDERCLDEEGYKVRRTWGDVLPRIRGDLIDMVKTDGSREPFAENPESAAYFRRDGRYVRAPASDQVRIPKGSRIFLQVDELNNRIDGEEDISDGVHGRDSELYKQVYIPPQFRLRICAFILSIWIFAALTGVCITIVPLVFGRMVFAKIIPSHVRKNDVYAFSIGIYILGSAFYAILQLKTFTNYLTTWFSSSAETPRNILKRITTFTALVARILWTYSAFVFLLPTLFAFVVELYAILPLHSYFFPHEPHTIHFVQSWTLGLLYVKLTTRLIFFYPESRPATALRAITRNGYLNPDAWLATRSFILPASFALGAAIAWPWLLAHIALMTTYNKATEEQAVLIYRYSYPSVLVAVLCILTAVWLVSCIKGWRMKIRDEVYLIGERLHNFGERKSGTGVNVVGARRIET